MNDVYAIEASQLYKEFPIVGADPIIALDHLDFKIRKGCLTALVGPDGAGKTTLIRLIAGLLDATAGSLDVLGMDVKAYSQEVQDRLSYMPQKFGLYEELSVSENMNLYADLHGIPLGVRTERFEKLLHMTGLSKFTNRSAGKLSGGMKQKLSLACTLVRSPELLLLDEPTVGVDPFSRRELWEILESLVRTDGISVLVSTAYMDEAERCKDVFVLNKGRFLATGTPHELTQMSEGRCFQVKIPKTLSMRNVQAALMDDTRCIADAVPKAGAVRYIKMKAMFSIPWLSEYGMEEQPVQSRLEDTFMMLLKEDEFAYKQGAEFSEHSNMDIDESAIEKERIRLLTPNEMTERHVEISVSHLVRKFGDFTAVANTSFTVQRGEVFGLLGPNGAGKTTTFRMLCGLLPVTSGDLRVAGVDVVKSRTAARSNFGYVAQKFSLYGNLSVMENLEFFAGVYGLYGQKKDNRIEAVIKEFRLNDVRDMIAGDLPGGYKQRLSMAAALMHEPKILFLDEPTSGIDPLTRRNFWRQITSLSKRGTTIIITTHFMDESEYCDRIMIQDAGKLVVLGTPDEVRRTAGDETCTMDEAFISVILEKREQEEDV